MQVFLPYASFIQTAKVLDNKRLGNQVYRECVTLIRGGWKNHPVAKMWKPYPAALALYSLELLNEMEVRRAWKPDVIPKWRYFFEDYYFNNTYTTPPWLGNNEFHSSHRAALLFKDPEYYGQFGWTEEPKLDYVWF